MKLHPLFIALSFIPLVGCGGSNSTPTSPTPTTTSLSGKVADGYLVGAEVCLDISKNKICEPTEPSATTTAGGEFTLEGVSQEDIDAYPLLVNIIAGVTTDEDKPTEALKAYTLSAPAGFTFVSPLTSMVQNEIDKGSTVEEAELQVQTKLGTTLNLNIDYVAGKTDTQGNIQTQGEFAKLHQIAQVTANVMAANMETLKTTSDEANIPVDDLIALISDKIFENLAEIKNQVESSDPNSDFDAATVANDINSNTINLDPAKVQEQIEQNNAENSAITTSLIDLLKNDGLNWFWGETQRDNDVELEYGTISLSGDLVTDTSYEFDFDSNQFKQEITLSTDDLTESIDNETWVLSENNGWINNSELITSITAEGDAIIIHYGIGDGQFDETISGTTFPLVGLNIALILNQTQGDNTWAKNIKPTAIFAENDFAYKLTFNQKIMYEIESHDSWCQDENQVFSATIKTNLNGVCNFIQAKDAQIGDYISTLEDLKDATLLVDWHYLGGNNYNQITAKQNADGSVDFWEADTKLASGSWSEVAAYGKTLIKVIAPVSVRKLGDHFNDDGSLYFAEYEGFVRQVWTEQSNENENELVFNKSAKDTILENIDSTNSLPLIGNWSNEDVYFQFNKDLTYNMIQKTSDDVIDSTTGSESGTYSYNFNTGEITVTSITSDNNGTSGLSDYLNSTDHIFKLESSQAGQSLTFSYVDEDESGEFTLTATTSETPDTNANSNPATFSTEYLKGKTFYVVWFGEGELTDENGNAIDQEGNIITNSDDYIKKNDVAVVYEQMFKEDGTLAPAKGLKNGVNSSALDVMHYIVDAAGILRITEEQDEATEGNIICDNSNPDYLKTHFLLSDADGVEQVDNVDLYFFDKEKAMTFANGLTQDIPRCSAAL